MMEQQINSRVKIRDGKIIKYGEGVSLEEAETIKYVKKHTSIPVPEIYKYYTENKINYIVMEYIRGETLESKLTNNKLSEDDINNICLELKGYVEELREIKGSYIGTINNKAINDIMFGEIGPYKDETSLNTQIINNVNQTLQNYYADFIKNIFISGGKHTFNLTHGDLTPRNIILDESNKIVGIIDWESAGYLPEYWEYAKSRIGVSWNNIWFSKIEMFLMPYYYENMLFNMVMKAYF